MTSQRRGLCSPYVELGEYRGVKVKKLIGVAGLLLAGLLMSVSASAYYVDGSVVRDSSGSGDQGKYTYSGYYIDLAGYHFGIYDGYIGNVNLGYPGPSPSGMIGTSFLVKSTQSDLTSVDSYVNNYEDSLPNASNVHWYRFTSDATSVLDVYYEWDGEVDSFTLELFEYGGSDSALATASFSSSYLIDPITGHVGHLDDLGFARIDAGDYLVRITGTSNGQLDGYSVYFDATAVPLPPAALLFVSALAGFGVVGRGKTRKTIS